MTKTVTKYYVAMLASAASGLQAQVLMGNDTLSFVGRIDFYNQATLPKSYLWHPNNANDESQTYLVLAMPMSMLPTTIDLLRNEGPITLELWPSGAAPYFGATTEGYSGTLKTANEKVGEGDFDFHLLHP